MHRHGTKTTNRSTANKNFCKENVKHYFTIAKRAPLTFLPYLHNIVSDCFGFCNCYQVSWGQSPSLINFALDNFQLRHTHVIPWPVSPALAAFLVFKVLVVEQAARILSCILRIHLD